MSWQVGLMLIFGFLVAVWVIAELVHEDRADVKQALANEAGRLAQRADWIERNSWRGPAS